MSLPEVPLIAGKIVSRETLNALDEFDGLLRKWSKRINLISQNSARSSWDRHIVDSAQLFSAAGRDFEQWCDLGSGGGLPGLVVAVLAREMMPRATVSLIESDARKAAFLKLAIEKLGLSANVIACRIENADPANAEVVSARALAPLDKLLGYVYAHCREGSVALLPKGQNYKEEISAASLYWAFDCEILHSKTDTSARILKITNLKPKDLLR